MVTEGLDISGNDGQSIRSGIDHGVSESNAVIQEAAKSDCV
jgi:hypothetical protein